MYVHKKGGGGAMKPKVVQVEKGLGNIIIMRGERACSAFIGLHTKGKGGGGIIHGCK